VAPDDFFAPMRNKKGYVLEHRLVMAKKLGRCLQPWEIPHHRDLDHSNNDPRNLELKMIGHGPGTTTKVKLVAKLHEAKAEIKQLKQQLKKTDQLHSETKSSVLTNHNLSVKLQSQEDNDETYSNKT
jgi:hypothetical protein